MCAVDCTCTRFSDILFIYTTADVVDHGSGWPTRYDVGFENVICASWRRWGYCVLDQEARAQAVGKLGCWGFHATLRKQTDGVLKSYHQSPLSLRLQVGRDLDNPCGRRFLLNSESHVTHNRTKRPLALPTVRPKQSWLSSKDSAKRFLRLLLLLPDSATW